jgi:hypothetical protein
MVLKLRSVFCYDKNLQLKYAEVSAGVSLLLYFSTAQRYCIQKYSRVIFRMVFFMILHFYNQSPVSSYSG